MELTSNGHVSEQDGSATLKYLNNEHTGFKTFVTCSQQAWTSFKYQGGATSTPLCVQLNCCVVLILNGAKKNQLLSLIDGLIISSLLSWLVT